MKIIKPSYEILTPIDRVQILKHIELCGRVCYKSEEKITEDKESASKFVSMIQNRNHESVLEHFVISVRFICNRGFTHELVRHRIASFSQESTRYCNYSKDKFGNEVSNIQPKWFTGLGNSTDKVQDVFYPKITHDSDLAENRFNGNVETQHFLMHKLDVWMSAMMWAEWHYFQLLKMGATPQEARGVLPIDLKTEIVITANLREWKHIFSLRNAPAAHPSMRELMEPLNNEFKEKLPEIFG